MKIYNISSTERCCTYAVYFRTKSTRTLFCINVENISEIRKSPMKRYYIVGIFPFDVMKIRRKEMNQHAQLPLQEEKENEKDSYMGQSIYSTK